jgi:Fe-S oxidoreductase
MARAAEHAKPVNMGEVKRLLDRRRARMKLYLTHCVRCSLCAESCFLYMAKDKDPKYMPSYKVIHTLGRLYEKRGKVDRRILEEIKEVAWGHCVLCTRCYCPIGVDVPAMIAFARSVCRSQGVYPDGEVQSSL